MIKLIKLLCFKAIIKKFPDLHKQLKTYDIDVSESKENTKYHFQFNSSMKIAKNINTTPIILANIIKTYIDEKTKNSIFNIEITLPGFVNFIIKNEFINKKIKTYLKIKKIRSKKEKIIIDYSSPNIAKEMHVGHLRSTIIGDCLARVLTYTGNEVIKISHLGDWGTQFGILIKYIKDNYVLNDLKKIKLQKLSNLYKEAQIKFETDKIFKNQAKNEVLNLQKEHTQSIKIWQSINKISKNEYQKIYKLLDVQIKYKGESFYKKLLNPIIKKLIQTNIITISDNAKCIYLDGFRNKDNLPLPLIIQKADGGFNYATTDLAALYYRIKYNKADKIIYITDVGQSTHFKMIFSAINKSKINAQTKLIHIPLGLMLTTEGKKIKTRSGKSEKLLDLLKNSINFAKKILKEKNKNISLNTLKKNSVILGINTIKYSDLSNKIDQNYIFDYNKILQFTGNTSSFLNYAYVRINSIQNKIKLNMTYKQKKNINMNIKELSEINLSIHILQYNYIIEKTAEELNPNILTFYLYKLAEKFHTFFHECHVIKSSNKNSRLLLCIITGKILKQGMMLLGLKIIKKM